MSNFTSIHNYFQDHLDTSLQELAKLCAQPSVAAQKWGLTECADLVSQMLTQRGFMVEIMPTAGAPVVFAERKGINNKTLLFYNHYDVQPPEPLDLWISPPFEPTIREGKMFARGVSDDKGHLLSRLFAIDAVLENYGELPCNVKFIIEGEEEISSIHLPEFIENHQSLLSADACIWEFGGVDFRDVPMQYLGMRGICYVELSAETAHTDVHSGLGGSIFPNAAWRLVWALNTLKDSDEHICIPGFYDNIIPPSPKDLEFIALQPEVNREYQERYGVEYFLKGLTGGPELRNAEVFEPTCTICGMNSGYQGPGSKTVLPARASAKVDFRLVPNQDPEEIVLKLRSHLDQEGFKDIEITYWGGESPAKTDSDDPFVQLVVSTAQKVYGKPMEIVPMIGGSGPNYPFINILHLPVATAGIGYPGSNAHAPNENMRLDLYLMGAEHIARIITDF